MKEKHFLLYPFQKEELKYNRKNAYTQQPIKIINFAYNIPIGFWILLDYYDYEIGLKSKT